MRGARFGAEMPGQSPADLTVPEAQSHAAASRLVLTIGLAPEDHHWLERIERPERFRYRPLGDPLTGADPELCQPRGFVSAALAELRSLPEPAAGIIAVDDYPSTLLAAAVAQAAGLAGPTFEAALMCSHKAWSRIVQREVAPSAVPRFQLIDPLKQYRASDLQLAFPFWLKPVKSSLSYLGFRVSSLEEVAHVQARARAELPPFLRAFTEMLSMSSVPLPDELAETTGEWLIAEELIGGRQCTLEGFCTHGRMQLLGIVDSVRLANRLSFSRFEYPSRLPRGAQDEMVRIAERVMLRHGFADGLFNIEFFVAADGQPKLIEINPRLSRQFSDLYAKVDGMLTHQVLVELASGLVPAPPRGEGRYRAAASFVLRVAADCIVRRVPSEDEIARVCERYPETFVQPLALPGERLSDHGQDSYTFRYALVHLGAESPRALRERFARVMDMLTFELEPVKQEEGDST